MKLEIETKEPEKTTLLGLHQEWLSGKDEEKGVSFIMSCGAGLGNVYAQITVKKGDKSIQDYFDIRQFIPGWVDALVEKMENQ